LRTELREIGNLPIDGKSRLIVALGNTIYWQDDDKQFRPIVELKDGERLTGISYSPTFGGPPLFSVEITESNGDDNIYLKGSG
jgi:hypothetical protein